MRVSASTRGCWREWTVGQYLHQLGDVGEIIMIIIMEISMAHDS